LAHPLPPVVLTSWVRLETQLKHVFTTHVVIIRTAIAGNAEGRFGGHTDTPLSPRGRRQAEATAQALASEKFDAIYSSDLPRAIETANPLARLTGAPLETTDALRERSVGVMEGLTFEEAAEQTSGTIPSVAQA